MGRDYSIGSRCLIITNIVYRLSQCMNGPLYNSLCSRSGSKFLPAAQRVLGRGHVLPGPGTPGLASAQVAVARSPGGPRERAPGRRAHEQR